MSSCSQPTKLGWSLEDIASEFDAGQCWWGATRGGVSILSAMTGVHWALCTCLTQAWSLNTVCPTVSLFRPWNLWARFDRAAVYQPWSGKSASMLSQTKMNNKCALCSNQSGQFACEWCFAHQKCWVRVHWGGPLSLLWLWQGQQSLGNMSVFFSPG